MFQIYFFHYSELVLDWDSCCEFIDQSLVQLYTNVSYKLNILQPKVKSAAADLKTKEISWDHPILTFTLTKIQEKVKVMYFIENCI